MVIPIYKDDNKIVLNVNLRPSGVSFLTVPVLSSVLAASDRTRRTLLVFHNTFNFRKHSERLSYVVTLSLTTKGDVMSPLNITSFRYLDNGHKYQELPQTWTIQGHNSSRRNKDDQRLSIAR